MCDLVVSDFLMHLKMLKEGSELAALLEKDFIVTRIDDNDFKSDAYGRLRDYWTVAGDMNIKTVSGLIDVVEAAPKMFDLLEKVWLEQQGMRSHSRMFISEAHFVVLCNYMLKFRDTRNKA